MPYLLLGLALLVALGFEFVNGFHDTANAVVWSGFWNFTGVVLSSGAVAFGIVSLLPVELILQVGGKAGFSMVFALLIAAIIWNLGTWYFGLPASSSHTLIGSIIGVGIANQLMSVKTGTSGVDWGQAANIGKSLLLSPVVGFICAALLPQWSGVSESAECGSADVHSGETAGHRHWEGKAEEQQAVYANRRRVKGAYGKRLLWKRGELIERSFAHCYDTGGMRWTHLRGHENILKRLLIHVGAFNLSLIFRNLLGSGRRES